VENSVDISAKIWNNPCKIRLFGDFCRVKSNLGGVDNYQTGIFPLGLFHRGRERHKRYFGGFCGGKVNEKEADIFNTIKLRNRKGSPFGRAPAEGG
jgi:hypothetical protein